MCYRGFKTKKSSLGLFKMGEKEGEASIWESPCTQFVVNRILVTFPKLTPGAKFDKAFRSEGNRCVLAGSL